MTENNIFDIIISAMGIAQKNKLGDAKKDYVLNIIKCSMNNIDFERYEPLINLTIDILKNIANNKELLKELISKSGCFKSCIN